MTGFGRTGRWFGLDHWGVRPDILVAAKGATSGYWPFGFVAASGRGPRRGHRRRRASSTASPTRTRRSARPSRARSCGSSRTSRWSRRARPRASGCRRCSRTRLGDHPAVGEIRGRGLLVGIELVADRETRDAVPARRAASPRRSCRAARERGVLLYSGTGIADGIDGDTILLGPPFVVTDDELVRIADVVAEMVKLRPRCRHLPRLPQGCRVGPILSRDGEDAPLSMAWSSPP